MKKNTAAAMNPTIATEPKLMPTIAAVLIPLFDFDDDEPGMGVLDGRLTTRLPVPVAEAVAENAWVAVTVTTSAACRNKSVSRYLLGFRIEMG